MERPYELLALDIPSIRDPFPKKHTVDAVRRLGDKHWLVEDGIWSVTAARQWLTRQRRMQLIEKFRHQLENPNFAGAVEITTLSLGDFVEAPAVSHRPGDADWSGADLRAESDALTRQPLNLHWLAD